MFEVLGRYGVSGVIWINTLPADFIGKLSGCLIPTIVIDNTPSFQNRAIWVSTKNYSVPMFYAMCLFNVESLQTHVFIIISVGNFSVAHRQYAVTNRVCIEPIDSFQRHSG